MSFKEQKIIRLFGRTNGSASVIVIQYQNKTTKTIINKVKKAHEKVF